MLRSKESNIRAFVKFTNCSERRIEIHWVNYSGNNILYTALNSNEHCVINTFVTHPWIFLCPDTGQRLCVNNRDVFIADAWFKFINKAENGIIAVDRQDAKIHLPILSLRETCMWKVIFLMQSLNDVVELDIPKTLKADLINLFYLSTRYREVGSGE